MTALDRARLGLFVGVLAAAAAVLVAVSTLADVSPIVLAPAYMFSPLVAGLAVTLTSADLSLSTVGLRVGRPRWLAAAVVSALALVGLTLALALAVPGIGLETGVDPIPGLELPGGLVGVAAALALAVALGATVNAVFAFGEEFGWRGYLLWELAPLGFWKASLAIGALWGLWHAPVIAAGYNYPAFPIVGVGLMTAACIAFSPVYTYLVVRAESVLAAALLHGVFNGSAGLVVAYAAADGVALAQLVANPVGAAGIVAFGLAALAIAAAGSPALTETFPDRGGSPLGGVTPGDD
ncbi:CAAX protease self-immunity [Halorientalis persicus]|uniref:CAAX protease self-immunity n=1 Tax=Halorientalis persicus TaxID=1367881 RepID=A0A1H8NX02_9EURY|nr:CPBP family intramembrane glutamic endopeptidase [Halorientalis persicus]SEO34137.1 CAAX protease self-immunity [Halorientalis persicus]